MLENEKAARDRDIIVLVVVVLVQLLEIIIPIRANEDTIKGAYYDRLEDDE